VGASGAWAGEGLVALQTADPSCPDESGKIYVDCGNGTVTDNRSGLVWLKNANCVGWTSWYEAVEFVEGLSDLPETSIAAGSDCGLSDGSSAGEWRLPSIAEWEQMVADAVALGCVQDEFGWPSITDDSGATCWQEGPGNSFTNVSTSYWSLTNRIDNLGEAWKMSLIFGIGGRELKIASAYVWPVRGGQ